MLIIWTTNGYDNNISSVLFSFPPPTHSHHIILVRALLYSVRFTTNQSCRLRETLSTTFELILNVWKDGNWRGKVEFGTWCIRRRVNSRPKCARRVGRVACVNSITKTHAHEPQVQHVPDTQLNNYRPSFIRGL